MPPSAEHEAGTLPLPNWLAYAITGVAMAGLLLLAVSLARSGRSWDAIVRAYEVHTAAPFAVMGAVILWRSPGHVMGWLLVAIGGCDAITMYGNAYQYSGLADLATWLPAPEFNDRIEAWSWIPTVGMIGMAIPQLFPNGRLRSRRWRVLAIVSSIVTLLLALELARIYVGADAVDFADAEIDTPLAEALYPLFGLCMLASLVPLARRYREARGDERQQFKWVLAGIGVSVPLIVMGTVGLTYGLSPAWALPGLVIFPASLAVAIIRYRLYDIDVVISKALVYAVLAAFIAGVYVAVVVGVGSLLGAGGEVDPVLSVAATALVAVAFQPVRRRLERIANRIVFGRRATPYDVLSGFARRIGAAASSPSALADLAELLAEGTGAAPARVWLRVGERLVPAAVAGGDDAGEGAEPIELHQVELLGDADHVEAVHHDGELLGLLTIAKPRGERVSEVDADLLRRLAATSGVLLRNLRLDTELAAQLEALEASRRRLVAAQDDARQRIEQALQDGARRQLGQLRAELTELRAGADPIHAPKTSTLIDQLVTAADTAGDTLDALAGGVYPPRLEADGLAAALMEQATNAPMPVTVHAPGLGRHGRDVEAAVYFSVLEALQNVAKYAGAGSAHVHLREAVGGQLVVDSRPGAGTTIRGEVPVTTAAPVEVPA